MEVDSFDYANSLNNMAGRRDDMTFCNTGTIHGVSTISSICNFTKGELYIYEDNLNSFAHNSSEYIAALKQFSLRNKKMYIVLKEDNISEEFLKFYKGYGLNIEIKLASKDFLEVLSTMVKLKDTRISSMYLSDNMYRVDIENHHSINNFNDVERFENFKLLFDTFFEKLQSIDVLNVWTKKVTNSRSLKEIYNKFKHLGISKNDIKEIVEFAQI